MAEEAGLSTLSQKIGQFASEARQHSLSFKQVAGEQNRSISKVVKDIGKYFSQQRGSLDEVSSAIKDSNESSLTVSRKLDNNNSLATQTNFLLMNMLTAMQTSNHLLDKISRSSVGGSSGQNDQDSNKGLLSGIIDSLKTRAGPKAVTAAKWLGGIAGVAGAGYAGYQVAGGNQNLMSAVRPEHSSEFGKQHVLKAMNEGGIQDNDTRAAIAAQLQGESGFKAKSETDYRNTSNQQIRKVFGERNQGQINNMSDQDLNNLKSDPEKFFNSIYGGDFGKKQLGNTEEGEGYRFRGRGLHQLTGKANYEKYSKLAFGDDRLVKDPDLMNDPETSAKVLVAYMKDRLPGARGNNTFDKVQSAMGSPNPNTIATKQAAYQQFKQTNEFSSDKQPNAAILTGGGAQQTPGATASISPTSDQESSKDKAGGIIKESGGVSVIQTPKSKKNFEVATPYAQGFLGFVSELENSGYNIREIGGLRRGDPRWHGKGMAIDINPKENPHIQDPNDPRWGKTDMPSNIGQMAAKYGLGWGGNWSSSKDTMHFSYGSNEGGEGGESSGSMIAQQGNAGFGQQQTEIPRQFQLGGMRGPIGGMGMGMGMNPMMGMMMGGRMGRTGGLIGLGASLLGNMLTPRQEESQSARFAPATPSRSTREIDQTAVQDKVEASQRQQSPVVVNQQAGAQQRQQNPINDPEKRNKVTSAENPWAAQLKEYYKKAMA